MDDNLAIFLVMTVAITASFLLSVIWMKNGRRPAVSEEERRQVSELAGENERLHATIGKLEQRLAVLERIATDPAQRTALEIEPANSNARTNLLFCLTHSNTISKAAFLKEHRLFGEMHDVPAIVAAHLLQIMIREMVERVIGDEFLLMRIAENLAQHGEIIFIRPGAQFHGQNPRFQILIANLLD